MKHWILLLYLGFSVVLQAQNTASVQEAMANYDYKTVINLYVAFACKDAGGQ